MAAQTDVIKSDWRAETRAMLTLALPIILTNITMMLVGATDVFLLAKLGPDPLAASAMGTALVFAMLLIGMGLVFAATPLMAAEIGRKPHSVRDVRRSFRQSLWAAFFVSLPMLALLWNTEAILRAIGQPERLAADTGMFVRAFMWVIWPALGIHALRGFISALSRPGWALVIGIVTVVLNAAINWALIFGHFGLPALGLWGAGIGSAITNWIAFLLGVVAVSTDRQFRRYRIFGRWWRSDWPRFRKIWKLGTPIALHMGFESWVFSFAVVLMGYISTASVAAHAIAIQIAAMTFMVPMGIAQAATVRVGMAYGQQDNAGIARSGWTAWVIGVGFMLVMAVVIMLARDPLVGLFLETGTANSRDVAQLAASFLIVAAFFQVFDGAQVVGTGVLRGIQDTTMPMIFAAIGYWVIGIGFGAWLGFTQNWGGFGLWTGLAVGLAIVAVLVLSRWLMRARLGLLPA